MEPIISVSGLRGVVGETLTPTVICRYMAAFAAELPPGPIVVGRDGRTTGPALAEIVRGALAAMGRDVIDLNVAATPTVGVMVRKLEAAGGVQISASHNPPPYNGLKLFNGEGRVIPAAAGEKVVANYRADRAAWAPFDRLGFIEFRRSLNAAHLELVLKTVDLPAIRRRRFQVVLDANHGSGAVLGRTLLLELGCRVTILGEEPSGKFSHPPEPTADNLAGVRSQLHGADVCFCQDPDADRLALIDETGRYVGEEYTPAICIEQVLRQTPGPIVTNCATSRMSQDLAEKYGAPFYRSAVGEANVVDLMKEKQAVFGGEGNGGPIDPRVGYVRDSFVGMALVLAAMAERKLPLSQLVDALPKYEIRKTSFPLSREVLPAAFEKLQGLFPEATVSTQDGLRLDWPDRWLIVRGSNTEPIVRAIAEAPRGEDATTLCEAARKVMSD